MTELSKLITISFQAQARYVIPRINNRRRRYSAADTYNTIIALTSSISAPTTATTLKKEILKLPYQINGGINQDVLDLYQEIYDNLHKRFVTGEPIQRETYGSTY